MTTAILFLTLLTSYALMFVIQEGKLPGFLNVWVEKLRAKFDFFEQLFGCAFCLGFWTGMTSYLLITTTMTLLSEGNWYTLLLTPFIGLASSATCFLLNQFSLMGAHMEDMEELPEDLQELIQEHLQGNLASEIHHFHNDGLDDDQHECGFCEECLADEDEDEDTPEEGYKH